jgi:hypothetical protein
MLRGVMLVYIAVGMILLFGINASGSVVASYLILLAVLLFVGVLLQFRNYRLASRTLGVRLTLTSFPPSDETKYVEWCKTRHLTPYGAASLPSEP